MYRCIREYLLQFHSPINVDTYRVRQNEIPKYHIDFPKFHDTDTDTEELDFCATAHATEANASKIRINLFGRIRMPDTIDPIL